MARKNANYFITKSVPLSDVLVLRYAIPLNLFLPSRALLYAIVLTRTSLGNYKLLPLWLSHSPIFGTFCCVYFSRFYTTCAESVSKPTDTLTVRLDALYIIRKRFVSIDLITSKTQPPIVESAWFRPLNEWSDARMLGNIQTSCYPASPASILSRNLSLTILEVKMTQHIDRLTACRSLNFAL